ncbi:MAG TPA: penicillin-binding transpeptidase domain-containing protein, partial [Acidobacteriaceae bacterium]|nr:penicillin-binding transpeptidase domain-containing protein [Acidobacteriaceae bacterium]
MRRFVFLLCVAGLAGTPLSFAASTSTTTTHRVLHRRHAPAAHRTTTVHHRGVRPQTATAHLSSATLTTVRHHHYRHRFYEHFTASSFATADLTTGDVTAGEDPMVRQAAVDALGDMNGTVVAIDPSNGRILAMVNQKLALSTGAEPCSTIKLSVALAALEEGIVTKETPVNLGGHY